MNGVLELPAKAKRKKPISRLPAESPAPSQPASVPVSENQNVFPSKAPARWRKMVLRDPQVRFTTEPEPYKPVPFYIAKYTPLSSVDPETRRWIRNQNDEKAAQMRHPDGGPLYRFSEKRGQFTVDWVQDYCVLYEGDRAGSQMELEDWQYEYFMQGFGWVMHNTDERWHRSYDQYRDSGSKLWQRRFSKHDVWIAKKNGKSPSLPAVGLYSLCGESEPGQHCFSVSKDGNQAMIAHKHAVMMVQMGPLARFCQIRRNDWSIRYKPTESTYVYIKGERNNSREGFNGNIFIDEAHVVGFDIVAILEGAGIARFQPLQVQMSTVGSGMSGYGYESYLHGQRVLRGEVEELNRLVIDFTPPQDVTLEQQRDEDLFIKVSVPANPALGRLNSITELKQTYNTARSKGQHDLSKVWKYRASIWELSETAWLPLDQWSTCERQYSLQDLMEYPCVGGLDLSKTRDMTAFSLWFVVPADDIREKFKFTSLPLFGEHFLLNWTWHWLPSETAVILRDRHDFFQYQTTRFDPKKHSIRMGSPYKKNVFGSLTIVEGKAIEYYMLAHHLDWVRENFDLRLLGYDKWSSVELLNILKTAYGWDEETFISIPQNWAGMSPATAEFERLLLMSGMAHPPSPCLDWQVSHCRVREDDRGNRVPIKPHREDFRKVDGLISQVIGLATLGQEETIGYSFANTSIKLDSDSD